VLAGTLDIFNPSLKIGFIREVLRAMKKCPELCGHIVQDDHLICGYPEKQDQIGDISSDEY
jgi:hypothetical protein